MGKHDSTFNEGQSTDTSIYTCFNSAFSLFLYKIQHDSDIPCSRQHLVSLVIKCFYMLQALYTMRKESSYAHQLLKSIYYTVTPVPFMIIYKSKNTVINFFGDGNCKLLA